MRDAVVQSSGNFGHLMSFNMHLNLSALASSISLLQKCGHCNLDSIPQPLGQQSSTITSRPLGQVLTKDCCPVPYHCVTPETNNTSGHFEYKLTKVDADLRLSLALVKGPTGSCGTALADLP